MKKVSLTVFGMPIIGYSVTENGEPSTRKSLKQTAIDAVDSARASINIAAREIAEKTADSAE